MIDVKFNSNPIQEINQEYEIAKNIPDSIIK